MARSVVRYATTADGLEIAYQVLGDGPIDIVIVPGLTSNVDRNADYPLYGGYLRRFPRFARTIVLDRRGGGISDREVGSGSAEDRMDDVRAVMDAVGCSRAALLGHVEGGAIAILFAATYPDRASALVLVSTSARWLAAPDYPIGRSAAVQQQVLAHFSAAWGTGRGTFLITSDAPDAEAAVEALGALERSIGTPRSMVRQFQFGAELDVRSVLPLIDVPTLVMHSPHTPWPEAQVRYTAEHIRRARYVDMPGFGSWDAVKQDACCDVIEEFLTGQRPLVGDIDRVLATVLFTDIVDSTRRAAELGDRRWRGVLDALDARAAAEVGRFRGRVVKRTGDGMLATFDGPARAVRCARAVADVARVLGLEVRAGLHTGEIEMRGGDVSGLAVHIGARIGSLAGAGEVLVSGTVRDLVVGSGLEFDERGEHELRGIEGRWRLLVVRPERGTQA
jgi:class 3 adenylate cyclase/pimeloyl-ACP methyl ester carboxylesterase